MKRLIMLSFFTSIFSLFVKAQSSDVSKFPPLNDLGTGTYMGHQGGLYPEGSNVMPTAFYNDAAAIAKSIIPLDASGKPDPNGKIGLIGLGASTVGMYSKELESLIPSTKGVNKELRFVNCGIGGQDLSDINNPKANFWSVIDARLQPAGISLDQVQVIWIEEDNLRNRSNDLDERGKDLVADLTTLVQFSKQHYPNLKLFYVCGRHTTAFIPADGLEKHMEPKPYINGWACKWLIEKQINGDASLAYKGPGAKAPLILWGPYFWSQGDKPREDGFTWSRDMVGPDGVHPTPAGIARVANDLVQFWLTDPVSQVWFLENPNTSITETESMQITVNKSVINEILYSDINDHFRMMVLKDSVIILKEEKALRQKKYNIEIKEPGKYNYVISDANGKAYGGKFVVAEDMTAQVIANQESNTNSNDSTSANYIDPNAPAWIVNGTNKLPKLQRLMRGHEDVKAVIYDNNGEVLVTVDDVLNQHTDLNKLLERGEWALKFFDENGVEIALPEDFRKTVRIKF